jgi:hypothetical protein
MMVKKRKYTICAEAENAPALLCGKYPRQKYKVEEDTFFTEFLAAYHIGQLTLCLRNDRSALVYVTSLAKRLDNAFPIMNLERVAEGVEQLSALTDWEKAEQTCQTVTPESEQLLLECDRIWNQCFGATFLWFQRLFQCSIKQALTQIKAIERSAI